MNWLLLVTSLLKLVPYVVGGINSIHAEKDSATKVQMAKDALAISTAAAQQVLSPENAAISNIVGATVHAGIESEQAAHDARKAQTAAPVAAVQTAPVAAVTAAPVAVIADPAQPEVTVTADSAVIDAPGLHTAVPA